ncbi:hypothetical protein M3Y98_00650800 [Aphelenchoides besseyi]|nr:hypothetical protein M3Y98_00650800 [Aphelenchoides besseyi]KAI6208678.1 hypothetical protein M3Y96_00140400 [Aphelenchoides besseyi]
MSSTRPIREPEDQYYRCIFGHVDRAVLIISIIGLVLSALNVLSFAFVHQYYSWSLSAIWICVYLILLYGNRCHQPFCYLPYLVVNTISILTIIPLSVVMLIVAPFISVRGLPDHVNEKDKLVFGILTGLLGAFLFCSGIISIYFNYVVYRGYRYLQDALLNPTINRLSDA